MASLLLFAGKVRRETSSLTQLHQSLLQEWQKQFSPKKFLTNCTPDILCHWSVTCATKVPKKMVNFSRLEVVTSPSSDGKDLKALSSSPDSQLKMLRLRCLKSVTSTELVTTQPVLPMFSKESLNTTTAKRHWRLTKSLQRFFKVMKFSPCWASFWLWEKENPLFLRLQLCSASRSKKSKTDQSLRVGQLTWKTEAAQSLPLCQNLLTPPLPCWMKTLLTFAREHWTHKAHLCK